MLSAFGANFDVVDEQGSTPLHLAAKAGHDLCCRFIAQRGKTNVLLQNIFADYPHVQQKMLK